MSVHLGQLLAQRAALTPSKEAIISAGQRLTFAQCLVGGYVGFGLLVAVLCFMTGGGVVFWLAMTTFLTVAYTAYYYFRTRGGRSAGAGSGHGNDDS